MKINNDGTRPLGNPTADPLAKTTGEQGAEHTRPVTGGSDALKLSPEARLLQAAADQTLGPPAIRKDVVDRMRALLDAGQVGNDPGTLADAMIDDWLNEP